MFIRFKIWRVRHEARGLSKHTNYTINAKYAGVIIGSFRNGREVKR